MRIDNPSLQNYGALCIENPPESIGFVLPHYIEQPSNYILDKVPRRTSRILGLYDKLLVSSFHTNPLFSRQTKKYSCLIINVPFLHFFDNFSNEDRPRSSAPGNAVDTVYLQGRMS